MRLIPSNSARSGSRPRVLLISPHSSYRIAPYLRAAEELGIDIFVVSQGEYSVVNAVASGLHVDFADRDAAVQKILAVTRDQEIRGVIGSDDSTVELACRIAADLGLVHNDSQAAILARRKDLARKRLQENGIPVPEFVCLDLRDIAKGEIPGLSYPVVVKPVCLSGSRGVIRVNHPDELLHASQRIERMLQQEANLSEWERTHVLAEAYIHGPEFAYEGLLEKGQLKRLALFDKPDIMTGPYFEETYYITPSRLEIKWQERIEQTLEQACAAYGLREGPVHAEMRIKDHQVWIMELAARTIGGQCARLLRYSTGSSLEQIVLRHAIGENMISDKIDGAAGVLMIPIPRAGILRRVEGIMRALKVPYIEDIEISIAEGYELTPLPEGGSYLGFLFARAPYPQQAEAALREAHGFLDIVISPVLAKQSLIV